jgi:hypothetical protein
MHSYYGFTLQCIWNSHVQPMGKLFQFCEQGMADNNMDFKYELSFPQQ